MNHVQPATCFQKWSFTAAFRWQWKRCVVLREALWPTASKIFTLWTFAKKFVKPCCKNRIDVIKSNIQIRILPCPNGWLVISPPQLGKISNGGFMNSPIYAGCLLWLLPCWKSQRVAAVTDTPPWFKAPALLTSTFQHRHRWFHKCDFLIERNRLAETSRLVIAVVQSIMHSGVMIGTGRELLYPAEWYER